MFDQSTQKIKTEGFLLRLDPQKLCRFTGNLVCSLTSKSTNARPTDFVILFNLVIYFIKLVIFDAQSAFGPYQAKPSAKHQTFIFNKSERK